VPHQFNGMGVSFLYPDNWVLDEDSNPDPDEGSATVFSPSGAFLSVSVYSPQSHPDDLAEQAVAGIREEYGDVDVELAEDTVAGVDLKGYNVNFFCMDLTSTAKVRCLRTTKATYAIFCQAEDTDFERLARVFEAITVSLISSLAH
jgi:hypothetical protein